ncbi:Xylose import ATP-binding protein XylG [Methylobacterium tardum]|jgi:putative multiple sugar transport system ATP-binding protein|uniref:Xylose ABC transporter ATP-binding protein n=1 Tax=Methylobacterium tardum TaxID=374432 RepID=A0AA37WX01_9HYPH|nr:multiple monosaccharide ABC transporter ATP-binding protein [Methylobacterium tardum]GJE48867.1 Xylose import ATP-binding protein XylG [Methylobacterium tardum]GLS74008.1 xylose ABC transporter ATP-binding protein [Methylobacterium tardum]
MQPVLEMRGISKTFPGVRALNDVNLSIAPAEIHALVGENGAGKSTLMKVLSGVYPHGSYEGEITYEGQPGQFRDISDSERRGIVIIHQELALVPFLSIAENIFLGNEPARFGIIDQDRVYARSRELLAMVGLAENPDTLVTHLGVGKQQLVEIAKALSKKVKLLILDEPTASLSETDSEALLQLLLSFKAQGIASILISHKLNEISKVADRITVLRDGTTVETLDCRNGGIDEDRIIRGMVGRTMANRYPVREPRIGDVLMEVEGWTVHHSVHAERAVVRDVSLYLRRGEIVGIAGLMGSGRTELAMSVFGRSYGQGTSGIVRIEGREVDVSTIDKAIAAGIAYVTEDRKQLGLVLGEDITKNTTLANLPGVSTAAVIDEDAEHRVANAYRSKMRIRSFGVGQQTVNLSGGNQQKVVLSKWLFTQPKVLILDEPTRGIDVGAKYEIYSIINELAEGGRGVLMISSEMPELLGLCDRIYVMNEGRFVDEFQRAEASQEAIMRAIMRSKELNG